MLVESGFHTYFEEGTSPKYIFVKFIPKYEITPIPITHIKSVKPNGEIVQLFHYLPVPFFCN